MNLGHGAIQPGTDAQEGDSISLIDLSKADSVRQCNGYTGWANVAKFGENFVDFPGVNAENLDHRFGVDLAHLMNDDVVE